MKKLMTTTLTLALLMPVVPLLAGEKGEKTCPEDAVTCAKMMQENMKERGWVGINMDYDKERGVTVITNVVGHSPAERAGFQVGDVLLGLNGVDYTEENEKSLKTEYASFKPGKTATFKVERGGKPLEIKVELEQIPQAILAQWVGQHILDYHQVEAEVATVEDEESDESP
jgi:C-terminal processing protease CtpA/Prc